MSFELATTAAIAALKRIARKPVPHNHVLTRFFFDYREKGEKGRITAVEVTYDCPATWHPVWAELTDEYEPCDCPRCIAQRALATMNEELGG